jgi:hypothetical protein
VRAKRAAKFSVKKIAVKKIWRNVFDLNFVTDPFIETRSFSPPACWRAKVTET